jgi:hypothetical protein
MDNLGGSVYVNGDWYKRKLGELRLRGIIRDYYLEHIQADPRLDKLRNDQSISEEQRKEVNRVWLDKLMKRVEHNAPENAAAIVVCSIDIGRGSLIKGCKWAGNGTSVKQFHHNGGSSPNPIAEANPTLFAETSSIRRAANQLFSHLSGQRIMSLPSIEKMDEEIQDLAERVTNAAPKGEARPSMVPEPGPQLLTSGYDEIGAFEAAQRQMQRREGDPVPAERVTRTPAEQSAFRAVAQRFAETPDPYEEPNAVRLPDIAKPVDFCPPDPKHPTPFDPDPVDNGWPSLAETERYQSERHKNEWKPGDDGDELVAKVKESERRPALEMTSEIPPKPPRELRKCFACTQMVSGPNTKEHDPTCTFYAD